MKFLIPLLLPLLPLSAADEKKPQMGVDASLVSENSQIVAGETFRVGLKLHHHPEYHTYWRNPGIAGVPTEIRWDLPQGFSAGPIQWPYPEKSKMAIYPVHGYERDVMLLVDITAPPEITASEVELKATANWMACAKGCFPAVVDLKMKLPVGSTAMIDAVEEAEFAHATEEIPRPLLGWTVELLSQQGAPEVRFRVTPDAATSAVAAAREVYFFSDDGQVSSDQPQKLDSAENGSFEITVARSTSLHVDKDTLPGVLRCDPPLAGNLQPCVSIAPPYPSELSQHP